MENDNEKIKKIYIYIYIKRREFPHCVNVENEMTAREEKARRQRACGRRGGNTAARVAIA